MQAFAQVPDIHVWYGPDTYMGKNLAVLLQALSRGTDQEVWPPFVPAFLLYSCRHVDHMLHLLACEGRPVCCVPKPWACCCGIVHAATSKALRPLPGQQRLVQAGSCSAQHSRLHLILSPGLQLRCKRCTPRMTWPRSGPSCPGCHYFDQGTCIVHHMFGAEVTQHVREAYPDALLTAHFEVCPVCLKWSSKLL